MVETRTLDEGETIKRRRICKNCNRRFTTYERVESIPLTVIKKDGTRAPFSKNKLFDSMLKACYKRQISAATLDNIASDIQRSFWNKEEMEIPTYVIGEAVMEELKQLDQVAYVRYAAVYREFADLNSFIDEIKVLLKEKNEPE